MAQTDGGPAFPTRHVERDGDYTWEWTEPGMTLRDYFAGQALAGIVATIHNAKDEGDLRIVARCCYAYADAMLETRPLGARLAAPTEQEG